MITTASTTESTSTSFTSLDQLDESTDEYFASLSDEAQQALVETWFQDLTTQLQNGSISQEEYDQAIDDLKALIDSIQEANEATVDEVNATVEGQELNDAQQAQYDGIVDGLEDINAELDELEGLIDEEEANWEGTFIDATNGSSVTPTNIQAGYSYMINLGGVEDNPLLDDEDDEIDFSQKQSVNILSENVDFEIDRISVLSDDGDTLVLQIYGTNGEETTITLEDYSQDYTAIVVDAGFTEDSISNLTEDEQKIFYWSGSSPSFWQEVQGVYANEIFNDIVDSLPSIGTNYLEGASAAQIDAATQILELIYEDPTAIDTEAINEIFNQYGTSDKAMIAALITETIFIEDNANFSTVMATLGGTFISLFEATGDEMSAELKTATLLIVGHSTGTTHTWAEYFPDEANPSVIPGWTNLETSAEALETYGEIVLAAGVANVAGDSDESIEDAQDAGGYVEITDDMMDDMMAYYNGHNWQQDSADDENVTRDDMELLFANYLNGLKNLTSIEDIRTYTTTFMSTYMPNGYFNDDMAASILWTFYSCQPDIFTALIDDATFVQQMWSWIDNGSRDPRHHDDLANLLGM